MKSIAQILKLHSEGSRFLMKEGVYSGWPEAVKALTVAVNQLKLNCGDRCAHQNPCVDRETLSEIKAILNNQPEAEEG